MSKTQRHALGWYADLSRHKGWGSSITFRKASTGARRSRPNKVVVFTLVPMEDMPQWQRRMALLQEACPGTRIYLALPTPGNHLLARAETRPLPMLLCGALSRGRNKEYSGPPPRQHIVCRRP